MSVEVAPMDMLRAREARALRQQEILARCRRPVISFTMNIAGPVKNSPVICRAFREGILRLEDALAARGLPTLFREETDRLLKDKAYLEGICRAGAEKAAGAANRTLRKVYKKVGFAAR